MALPAQKKNPPSASNLKGSFMEAADGPIQDAVEPELSRKEKRKLVKKQKRHQVRSQLAEQKKQEEEAELLDPATQLRLRLEEAAEEEALRLEQEQHERDEAVWLERERLLEEAAQRKREQAAKEEEWRQRRAQEEAAHAKEVPTPAKEEDSEEDDVGPPEIIWQGNEIIVRKRGKKSTAQNTAVKDDNRPTHNPFPPQERPRSIAAVAILPPTPQSQDKAPDKNFGTEQDRENCSFYLKTGACRFGERCSRQHLYPTTSCIIHFRNFYVGIGMAKGREDADADEELEYDDEEAQRHFVEFYEDVHPEFAIYGELVNLKVCCNHSAHLKGNVYVHYKDPEVALQALTAINGRFYAGKQVFGEFSPIRSWRQAICGTFAANGTCTRGNLCNFLHCFKNPNDEYWWADKDRERPHANDVFRSTRRLPDEYRHRRESSHHASASRASPEDRYGKRRENQYEDSRSRDRSHERESRHRSSRREGGERRKERHRRGTSEEDDDRVDRPRSRQRSENRKHSPEEEVEDRGRWGDTGLK